MLSLEMQRGTVSDRNSPPSKQNPTHHDVPLKAGAPLPFRETPRT